jgi:hypothetical protein
MVTLEVEIGVSTDLQKVSGGSTLSLNQKAINGAVGSDLVKTFAS